MITTNGVSHDVWKLLPGLKPRRSLLSPEVCRGDAGALWARMMISDDMRLPRQPHCITGDSDPVWLKMMIEDSIQENPEWFTPDDPLRQELQLLRSAYGEWLLLPDGIERYDQLDIALAVIVANRYDSSPLWLLMVAPPSSGKSETIMLCINVRDTHSLSALTTKTLASGSRPKTEDGSIDSSDVEFVKAGKPTDSVRVRQKGDPSLLHQLNGKTVLMKDFGTVLSARHDDRKQIFGQLREVYDGAFYHAWGTGAVLDWKGKIGILAGVTSVIDTEFAFNSALGERFIMYRLTPVNRREQGRRALAQQLMGEADKREQLQALTANYLQRFIKPTLQKLPSVPDAGVNALADYVARARTSAMHDSQGHVSFIEDPEGTPRLIKQFSLLAQALAVVRREHFISKSTFRTVARVAYDTIVPAARQRLLATIIKHGEIDIALASRQTKLSEPMTRNHLAVLTALELIAVRGGSGRAQRWTRSVLLKELMIDIEQACGYPAVTGS